MKLAKRFQIFEADRKLTLLLGLTHLLVSAAHSFFDIGATALLVGHLGPETLPEVYLAGALLLIFVGLVIIPIVDRLDRVTLFSLILVGFAVPLLGSSQLAGEAPDLWYRGLYVACFLMKSLVFLQFWLLAGDLLDIRQAKRLFPLLLGFSLVGGLSASLLASVLPRWLSTESFLAIAGILLLGSVVPVRMLAEGSRRSTRPPMPRGRRLRQLWRGLRGDIDVSIRNPLLRTLSIFILLLALLAQVLDFLVGTAAHAEFTTAGGVAIGSLTAFYAVLNAVVIGAGVVVQLLLANRIISSVGVTRGELAAPIAFLAAFLATGAVWLADRGAMTTAFFATALVSRALQKVLRITIVRTSTDLIYNAIPAERRGRAKAFKETLIEPFGVLLSGLFLLASTTLPLHYILGGSVVLSALFLASTLQLKSRYMESLVGVLKEKSRFRFAFPSMVMRQTQTREDAAGVSGLRRALQDDETSIRLLAVEVASELKEPEAASLLVDRFREETEPEVRARMLGALGKMIRKQDGGLELDSLADLDPNVRASGMESLAQSGIYRSEPSLPESRNAGEQDAGARALSAAEKTSAADPSAPGERRQAFWELARRTDRESMERLVHYLDDGDGATRHLAARALESCGDRAIGVLTLALWSTDVEGRRYAIRALAGIGSPQARQSLLPVLSLEAEEAYYDLHRLQAIRRLPPGDGTRLLEDSIVQRVERGRRNAHQVLRAAFLTEPGMRLILSNLTHPDRYVRSSAIEALELRVDSSLLGGILPLFEHENPRSIAEHGGALFTLPTKPPEETLLELTRHRAAWIRACAAYALGEVGGPGALGALERLLDDGYELARLNAVEALGRLADAETVPLLEAIRSSDGGRIRDYADAALAEIQRRG